jgi:hypothetical protein
MPEELDELALDELELLEDELLEDELLEDELDVELEEFDELPPHPTRPSTSTQTLVAVTKRDASFLSNMARPYMGVVGGGWPLSFKSKRQIPPRVLTVNNRRLPPCIGR